MSQVKLNKVLILGGTCELAIETANHLSEYELFLTYRDETKRKATESIILQKVNWIYCDFSDKVELPIVDSVIDFAHSELDGLLASLDDEEASSYWLSMVATRQQMLKQITRKMIPLRSGRLIFISSTAAALPNSGQGIYAASKRAIESLYQSIGIELGKKNITTVSLRLGYLNSGRGEQFIKNQDNLIKRIPARKWVELSDVAKTLVFLLSPASAMINATTITMDGGLTATK